MNTRTLSGWCTSAIVVLLLVTASCQNGARDSNVVHGGGGNCPDFYFEGVGDLPNDAYASAVSDISADGARAVGQSWTDDPAVAGDGSAGYPHGYEGIGWTRPCEGRPFYRRVVWGPKSGSKSGSGSGLVALGYWLPSAHPESNAYGISPDGDAVVGFATMEDDYHAEATTFTFGSVQRMGMLTGDTGSAARDVSDDSPLAGRGRPWSGIWAGSWMQRPHVRPRVMVGWSSPANNHPFRVAGSHAVYWDAFQTPVALPLPSVLPNGRPVISAEAVTVSNDGRVIAGNLYFDMGGYNILFPGYGITWEFKDGAYAIKAILSGPVEGLLHDCRVARISGNGSVVVGYFVGASGETSACSWNAAGGAAQELPLLASTVHAAAYGVNKDGSVIVGYCGDWSDAPPYFNHKATIWKTGAPVADLAAILQGLTPPVSVPGSWVIECRSVSDDGKIIAGWAYRPDPLDASNPEAFTEEGWVAKIP